VRNPDLMLRNWAIVGLLGVCSLLSGCTTEETTTEGTGILLVANRGAGNIAQFRRASTAEGAILPQTYIRGSNTRLSQPGQLSYDATTKRLIVPNGGDNSILFFDDVLNQAEGVPPTRSISGVGTQLNRPVGVILDSGHDELYVANGGTNNVIVFSNASTIEGGTAPLRTLGGSSTRISSISAIWLDSSTDRLWVADPVANSLLVFNGASTINGNVPPNRVVLGTNTRLTSPQSLLFINKQLFVGCTSSILRFDQSDSIDGNIAPTAVIEGTATLLSRPQQMAFRPDKEELFVADTGASAVFVYENPTSINGGPAPLRRIQGSQTGFADPAGLVLDFSAEQP
jgi:DNA-binding beta-propeller fold protein YncE